jgi:phosphosulfolactate phosphohydrolase-like enzyme
MGSITRKRLLRHEFDVSLEDIRAAERIARKIQIQRFQTAQQGKTGAAIEYAMESARRKMHRIFSNRSRLESVLPIPQKDNGLLPDRAHGERLSP